MKTVVGVYNTQDEAVAAIKKLKEEGYEDRQLSMIGRMGAGQMEDNEGKMMKTAGAEIGVTAIAGSALGALAGLGIFVIPGLGFLYGAGALVGAIAGFDFGLIGGGIITALTLTGMKNDAANEYEQELHEGKVLLIVHGSAEEVKNADTLLEHHGTHTRVGAHS
jgi:hypothetical protein